MGGVLKGNERDELDHLAELGDVIEAGKSRGSASVSPYSLVAGSRVLNVLGEVSNLLVEVGREEGESGSGLEEDLLDEGFGEE